MKVLNIGSLNIDYTYKVDHIVSPKETQSSLSLTMNAGGKGFNQSVALAKAGVEVYHAGMVGEDGKFFFDLCQQYGVHTDYIKVVEERTGHAIIQVDKEGQNCILLYGGANLCLNQAYIQSVLKHFQPGDYILLQNEVNLLDEIIKEAAASGLNIVLNPSPYHESITKCDLSKVHTFLMNEVEGEQITGEKEPVKILEEMNRRYPKARVVLTLGEQGVMYRYLDEVVSCDSFHVDAVDTTAAGDTFTGYFLAGCLKKDPIEKILKKSSKASSIAVTRYGAAKSIPYDREVK